MRSRIIDGITFEQRVYETLVDIKESIKENPGCGLSLKGHGRTNDCVKALKSIGVLLNFGTCIRPVYKWQEGVILNMKLANKVATIVREDRRKKYVESKAAKTPIDIVPNKRFVSDITDTTKYFLSSFSGQELWDELKNKGYSIVDNKLCKVEYLN